MTSHQRDYLVSIARYQRCIIFAILAYVVVLVVQFAMPKAMWPLFGLAALPVLLGSVVCVFLLACKLYGAPNGVLLGLLSFIPLVGLVVLLRVNAKATQVLKDNGVRVGLLGASVPRSHS